MNNKLYLSRASRFVEKDSVRGVAGGTQYSNYRVVVSPDSDKAAEKLLGNLNDNQSGWENPTTQELTNEPDVPLESRIAILREVLSVIE